MYPGKEYSASLSVHLQPGKQVSVLTGPVCGTVSVVVGKRDMPQS